jgi:hypothetical protein
MPEALYEEVRDHNVDVPLTKAEYAQLTDLARRLGRSRSNLVRRALGLVEENEAQLRAEVIRRGERWREVDRRKKR